MYANLRVTIKREGKPAPETLEAWAITQAADGACLLVHLDKQDGSGDYAEPAGLRRIELAELVSVEADF